MGEYSRVFKGGARSLDYSSYAGLYRGELQGLCRGILGV